MSAPNGQGEGQQPSKSSTPAPEGGNSGQASGQAPAQAGGEGEQGGGGRDRRGLEDSMFAPGAQGGGTSAGQERGRQPQGGFTASGGGRRQGRGQGGLPGSSSRASSRAPSVGGSGREVRDSLGKRKRGPPSVADALAQLAKRPATGTRMIPGDEVTSKKDALRQISDIRPKDPKAKPTDLVTSTMPGSYDAVLDPRSIAGWGAVANTAGALAAKGAKKLHLRLTALQDGEEDHEKDDIYQSDYKDRASYLIKDREFLEISDDDERAATPAPKSEAKGKVMASCAACASAHHLTRDCHYPHSEGMTVVCPFHGCSAMAKRGVHGHNLDYLNRFDANNRLLLCNLMVQFEDAVQGMRNRTIPTDEYKTCLQRAFQTFVVERRRKPACRVVKMVHCFISIAIRYSEVFDEGKEPREVSYGWPYTKKDAQNPEIAARLRQCKQHDWRQMPAGELERLSWPQIKERYGNSALERQLYQGSGTGQGQSGSTHDRDYHNEPMTDARPVVESPAAPTGTSQITGNNMQALMLPKNGNGPQPQRSDTGAVLGDTADKLERRKAEQGGGGAPAAAPKGTTVDVLDNAYARLEKLKLVSASQGAGVQNHLAQLPEPPTDTGAPSGDSDLASLSAYETIDWEKDGRPIESQEPNHVADTGGDQGEVS